MDKAKYLYKTEEEFTIYEFISEGSKGRIRKMVEYTETATIGVYTNCNYKIVQNYFVILQW